MGQGSPRPQGGKTSQQRWPARPGVSVCMYVHVCLPVNMYMDIWACVTGSRAWEHRYSRPFVPPQNLAHSTTWAGHLHTHLSFQGRPLLDMGRPRHEVGVTSGPPSPDAVPGSWPGPGCGGHFVGWDAAKIPKCTSQGVAGYSHWPRARMQWGCHAHEGQVCEDGALLLGCCGPERCPETPRVMRPSGRR